MTIFADGVRGGSTRYIEDMGVSLGESLGATASEAVEHMPIVSLGRIGELSAAQGAPPDLGGGFASPDYADLFKPERPDVPIEAARAKIKEAGLDKALHLPDQPSIRSAALDIMLERASHRRELQATLSRGPSGFVPGALSIGTSFLVSALDPLNVASAFIPVIRELRYGKLMAEAGGGAIARAGVRARVGAASGAVGAAAVEPLEAIARTQEGADYTMADALRSVMFGTVLGGGLHSGGGAVADVVRARRGTKLYPFGPGESHFDPVADLFKVTPKEGGAAAAPADGVSKIDDSFLNPKVPEVKEARSQSLLEFLAARGGLRNDDAMIEDVRSSIGSKNHLVGGVGPLIRKPGEKSAGAARGGALEPMSLDQAREAAVEAGYLRDSGRDSGGVSTTNISTLLDAIDGEMRGTKLYPQGEGPRVDVAAVERVSDEELHRREGAAVDLDRALQGAGFKPGDVSGGERARAIDLMARSSVEPLEAYELAVMAGPPTSPVVATLDDLPPRAKEDLLRGAIAALHDGQPVSAWEQMTAAAKTDPRIAESMRDASQGGPADPAAADADWHALANRPRDFDEPDALAASQAAEKLPEPASMAPEPNKRIQAAEAAAAAAEAEYKAHEPYLPEDLRARVEADLAKIDIEAADRAHVLEKGAACLTAARG